MKTKVDKILEKDILSRDDIIFLLSTADAAERDKIYKKAYDVKNRIVGNKVYLRGLIEFSNICKNNCYYCGIRHDNKKIERYALSDKEVLDAIEFSWKNKFASIVIQSGERNNKDFVERIDNILKKAKQITNNEIGITLSVGEQTEETYKRWFESGAHRYLLRIEASNKELFKKIHPNDNNHSFEKRLKSLENLKKTGYQTGTGVMIGMPFQTIEDLADDLLFMKNFDIDMVGMGPYIEHKDTPLFKYSNLLMSKQERLNLTLNMIAVLRIMMKDINIASTTALHSIDNLEVDSGLIAGANVIMPNVTPLKYRLDYFLYDNKSVIDACSDEYLESLKKSIILAGDEIGFDKWGDSKHFQNRN